MIRINEPEYVLMKKYIEEHCGIHLQDGKEYLIESRLTDLVLESGCNSFQEFHLKARMDYTGKFRDRIVDAMTTNETLWFRDESASLLFIMFQLSLTKPPAIPGKPFAVH